MRHSNWNFIALALLAVPVGCNLDPGTLGGDRTTGSGGSSPTGSGGTAGCGSPNGTLCGQSNIPIAPLPPDVLIAQSKALSMTDGWDDLPCQGGCGASSKWSQSLGAITTVVASTDTSINWGLDFYGISTCGTTTMPDVPVAPRNSQAVLNAFAANQPATSNPIETAVNDAATYLLTLTDPNPKYLLLVTDGLPNCMSGNTNPMADDSQRAEAAVANARMAGIATFVVGLGTSSDATVNATLDQMAINGGGAETGGTTSYYAVTDSPSLAAALTAIVGAAASCTLPLTNVPPGQTNVAVSASDSSGKNVKVPQDPSDGWSFTDAAMDAIILNGTACANLRSGVYSNFQFIYSCADVIICIE